MHSVGLPAFPFLMSSRVTLIFMWFPLIAGLTPA
jgi:hypothetical protein